MAKKQKARKPKNAVFLMHVHLVFVTKYRKKVFGPKHLNYIQGLSRHICKQKDCVLKEFNGEKDHVHLLIDYPPKIAVTELVDAIKGPHLEGLNKTAPI